MSTILLALVGIGLSVAAQFTMKAGMSSAPLRAALEQGVDWRTMLVLFSNKYILTGLFMYAVGAIAWLGVLSRWEVSKAYPLVGSGFVLTVLIGLALGEQVTALRAAGVALICAGVFLVGQS